MNHLHTIAKGLSYLLFPPICACCPKALVWGEEQYICRACHTALPVTNFHLLPNNPAWDRFRGRIPIRKATSFLYFTKQGRTQKIIHQFKYNGQPQLGFYLGQLFADLLHPSGWLEDIDLIIPVPLHPKKKRRRGYNQSFLIAQGLGDKAGIPIAPKDTIIKTRNNESQTLKGNLERLKNVRNVFHLSKPEIVAKKHVLLVDDVLTTGATLESCALEVSKGNPQSLQFATLAYASDL